MEEEQYNTNRMAEYYRQVYVNKDHDLSQFAEQVRKLGKAEKSKGRLIDFIMQDPSIPSELKDDLDGTTIISATNVSNYYWQETDQENWDMVDFPNIAPPFERFWLDFNAPERIVSEEHGVIPWPATNQTHWGFHCLGFDLRDPEAREEYLQAAARFRPYLEQFTDTRWGMDIFLYMRLNGDNLGPLWFWRILIDDQGQVIRNQSGETVIVTGPLHSFIRGQIEQLAQVMPKNQAEDAVYRGVITEFHTAMLAISFLHCKNIALEEITPPRKEVHNKAQKRRGVKPYQPVPYKVLNIMPMKQVLRSEGRSGEVGTKRSLHICRGHFKHYENGRGLFGRYKGTFWFPQQVRGEKARGVTTKDYNIVLNKQQRGKNDHVNRSL